MTAIRTKVSETGRLSLPAELRKAVGLERGGEVIVELDGRELRIRTLDEAVTQAQALTARLLAGKAEGTVEAFLAERRAESARE
jgi:AbrB family looped-hinge helix DNA binding protein